MMTSEATIPEQGQPAPQFCLPDTHGEQLCLKDLAGKWVVLYFYPKDNTSGCTTEALEFTAIKSEFESLNAVVLGVSKDSGASHEKFIEKHGLTIRLLSDPEKVVLQLYGAWRMKKMYGKESMGVVRSTFLIAPDQNIAKAWPRVAKAAGHAGKVLDALRELAGE